MATPFLYHWLPEAIDEVRMTAEPAQGEVLPLAVIVGVVVTFITVTTMALDAAE